MPSMDMPVTTEHSEYRVALTWPAMSPPAGMQRLQVERPGPRPAAYGARRSPRSAGWPRSTPGSWPGRSDGSFVGADPGRGDLRDPRRPARAVPDRLRHGRVFVCPAHGPRPAPRRASAAQREFGHRPPRVAGGRSGHQARVLNARGNGKFGLYFDGRASHAFQIRAGDAADREMRGRVRMFASVRRVIRESPPDRAGQRTEMVIWFGTQPYDVFAEPSDLGERARKGAHLGQGGTDPLNRSCVDPVGWDKGVQNSDMRRNSPHRGMI